MSRVTSVSAADTVMTCDGWSVGDTASSRAGSSASC
jgi:hypothetical protein